MDRSQDKTKSIRLFNSSLMESLTHVHPITPLVMWGPFISYMYYYGATHFPVSTGVWLLIFISAILGWTLTEYLVHRFAFHHKAKNRWSRYIVFLFHGIHHDDPDDKTRLVMPPLPATMFVIIFWNTFKLIFSNQIFYPFLGSFLVGYLIYDYIHYGTHHMKMNNKVGRFLKKWHLQHHYSKGGVQYGVSNPFWDYIFRTIPKKRRS